MANTPRSDTDRTQTAHGQTAHGQTAHAPMPHGYVLASHHSVGEDSRAADPPATEHSSPPDASPPDALPLDTMSCIDAEPRRHDAPEPDALDRAVEFAKLVANSSLGTAIAREQRLAGRKEIDEMERAHPGSTMSKTTDQEREFDLEVATELELRGYTFEAELRYRAALRCDRPAKPLTLLAQLLEAKGRYSQGLPLYVCAARAHEPNALFRLATISYQLGEPMWSRDFVQLGSAALEPEQMSQVTTALHDLKRRRRVADLGELLTSSAARARSIDATYALGSMLLTSGRDDLARLAFSTAVSGGHTLAGISLMDLPGRRREQSLHETQAFLNQVWHDDFGPQAWHLRRDRPAILALDALTSTLGDTRGSPTDAISAMLEQLSAQHARREGASYRVVPDRTAADQAAPRTRINKRGIGKHAYGNEDVDATSANSATGGGIALSSPADDVEEVLEISPWQPLLVLTRTVTTLRGLVRIGFDATSLDLIDDATQRSCTGILDQVANGKATDTSTVIEEIWRIGTAELGAAKQRRRILPPIAPRITERVPVAGSVQRFRKAVASLDRSKRQALLLGVTGLPNEVIGQSMKLGTSRDVHNLFYAAIDRLHVEQQGEQFDPQLWSQVESCFSMVPQELRDEFDSIRAKPRRKKYPVDPADDA